MLADIHHHPEQLSADSPHVFELRVIFLLAGFTGTFQAADFFGYVVLFRSCLLGVNGFDPGTFLFVLVRQDEAVHYG